MKKRLLFVLLISFSAFSQTEEQLDAITASTCNCLQSKTEELENADASMLEIELGLCMMTALNENNVDIDLSDISGMEKLGEEVGFQLVLSCPEFMNLIGAFAEDDPQRFEDLIENSSTVKTKSAFGKALEVNANQFVTLKVLSDDGRKETFYWLQHFEGAHLLDNNGESIRNKEVYIDYEIVECYSPKLGDYTNIKVLRGLYTME